MTIPLGTRHAKGFMIYCCQHKIWFKLRWIIYSWQIEGPQVSEVALRCSEEHHIIPQLQCWMVITAGGPDMKARKKLNLKSESSLINSSTIRKCYLTESFDTVTLKVEILQSFRKTFHK